MDARDLRPEQLAALLPRLRADLAYYRRLKARMDSVGWRTGCPAYLATDAAVGGLAELVAALESSQSEALGATWAMLKAGGFGKHGRE